MRSPRPTTSATCRRRPVRCGSTPSRVARMATVISVHSFRGGTGKSNTTANVATLLAREGKTVAVVDLDIQSPGVHVIFRFNQDESMRHSLNDYLWGDCA